MAKWILQVLAAAVFAVFILTTGGRVEGLFFPVVGDTILYETEPVDATHTRIWGQSERLRDCTFERLDWSQGQPGHSSVAPVDFEEGTKVRGGGDFAFGPWVVEITESQLRHNSFAQVYHRCHRLWLTETRFYP